MLTLLLWRILVYALSCTGAVVALHATNQYQKPLSNPHDICRIFKERPAWLYAARKSERRWHIPIPLMMAVIRHESSFQAHAQPLSCKKNKNSAYGYAQAKKNTWQDYAKKNTYQSNPLRYNFSDSIDFVGWYLNKSKQVNKLKVQNAMAMYLTYHEGWTGYKAQSWRHHKKILKTAYAVQNTYVQYKKQLKKCVK
ncbi:MAG: transglycosylase SLT domain-containing protein [Endozoicomonadaceae bacterium]|nr:transglycosylase SLT domain-containing protein [Endozoicomonadaceae bacterium]